MVKSKVLHVVWRIRASQVVNMVKSLPANAGDIRDLDLIPGPERPPGRGNDNPLQYFFLIIYFCIYF